jgi:hypothetical protein
MTLVITPLNALIKPDPTSESNPITYHAVAAVTTVSNMVKMSSIAGAHLSKAPTTILDLDVVVVKTVSLTATVSSIAGAHLSKAPTTILDLDVVVVKTVSHTATVSSIAGAHLPRAPTTKLDHDVVAVITVSHTATVSAIAKAFLPRPSNQPQQDLPTPVLFPRVPLQQTLPHWLPHPLNIRLKQL